MLIGDIVGRPGRNTLAGLLPGLVESERIDFVVANGENAAGGLGITPGIAKEIFDLGVDVITTGNHVFRHESIKPYLDEETRLLRPANLAADNPGNGFVVVEKKGMKFAVVNLLGEIFFNDNKKNENPFAVADRLCTELAQTTPLIFVDFHAEATSEKIAMGYHLDGRATAVVGTHTHVQTADAALLGKGTAYLTDLGMTGPSISVIGVDIEKAVNRFVTGKHQRFSTASGPGRLDACVVQADKTTGRAVSIRSLRQFEDDL